MEDRRAVIAHEFEHFVVALRAVAGPVLVADQIGERARAREPARDFDALDHRAAIDFGRQIIGRSAGAASGSRDLIITVPREVGRNWHTENVQPGHGMGLAPAISADSAAK